jgi:hypothetical protein
MGMEARPQKSKVIVLFILVESKTPPTCEMIAEYAQQEKPDVEDVLKEWFEYLRKQEIGGKSYYSIYHASFLEFLRSKGKLDSNRKLFKDVATRMADCLYDALY